MFDEETPLIQNFWGTFRYYVADISQFENH